MNKLKEQLWDEKKSLCTASNPLSIGLGLWIMLFVIHQEAHKQLFLEHINNIDPAIKFTAEGNQENGAMPFLDTLVLSQNQTFLYLFLCIENPPTLTSTCSGIAIII